MSCLSVLALVVVFTGCVRPLQRNRELTEYKPHAGYRFETLRPGEGNTDSVFLCLTFSGGGTRSAALAYGVLQELQRTEVLIPDGPKPLIHEVDLISAVSGGAFTAMAYGLWREEIFDGRFERRFLYQNVQRDLLLNFWKPKYLFRLPSVVLDRIDVAGDYYDEKIFKHKTYADLLARGDRPFLVINATNVALAERFEFSQADFDLLGSDLGPLPVGWAVAASSAFPFLLSPLRLKYFPGAAASQAIESALAPTDANQRRPESRRGRWAEALTPSLETGALRRYEIDEAEHRYLYLLDGGLADNLGLAHVLDSYYEGPIRSRIDAGGIQKLVVIVVDAGIDPPEHLERRTSAPGLFTVGLKTATTSMNRHSATLTSVVRNVLLKDARRRRTACDEYLAALAQRCPDGMEPAPPCGEVVESYVIEINFRDIPDERKRRTFLSMLPSFFLPSRDVDALIDMGRWLLREDPEFRRLVQDLN